MLLRNLYLLHRTIDAKKLHSPKLNKGPCIRKVLIMYLKEP